MIINRHIMLELFRHVPFIKKECTVCSKLPNYQEIMDGGSAEEAAQFSASLHALNLKIGQNYIALEETLYKCGTCGTYFGYREWQPGGSDDALRTYNYEALRRLNFLEVHLMLVSAAETMSLYAKKDPGSYEEEGNKMFQAVSAEMDALQSAAETITQEADALLKIHPSQKTNEYYRSDVLKGEEEIQRLRGYYAKVK